MKTKSIKKKLNIWLLLGFLMSNLVGCGKTIATETQNSISPTIIVNESIEVNSNVEVSNIVKGDPVMTGTDGYNYYKKVEVDLDGDGIEEKIEIIEDGKNFRIDDKIYSLDSEDTTYPDAIFSIIDLDTTDLTIEIIVPGICSDRLDSCTDIFRFKEDSLYYIGGIIQTGDVTFDNKNHLFVAKTIDIHESNSIIAQYSINNDEKLEMDYPKEGYEFINYENHVCKLLVELPVYPEKDRTKEAYVIKPQNVRFRSTDAKNWVEVVAEDGTIGWMYVGKGYIIEDLQKESSEVFEGLWFFE